MGRERELGPQRVRWLRTKPPRSSGPVPRVRLHQAAEGPAPPPPSFRAWEVAKRWKSQPLTFPLQRSLHTLFRSGRTTPVRVSWEQGVSLT